MIFEPIIHILFMLVIFTVIRIRVIAGANTAIWLLIGLTCFFTARNIYQRGMEAVNANQALFAYRQVLPVDPVVVRSALETLLGILVTILLLLGAAIYDLPIIPWNPAQVLFAFLGMCLCGLGLSLTLSVASTLVSELGRLISILFTPLYFLSGVVFPVSLVPVQYREWLFLNPFAHGLELLRGGYFPVYHVAPEANFLYLYGFAIALICLGLMLQVRYSSLLRAQ